VSKVILKQEADRHHKAKRYWEALVAYEKIIQLDPADASAYVGKGNCLRNLEQYWESLDAIDIALRLEPNNVAAYNSQCYTYVELKYYDMALEAHKKAIKIDPRSASAYNGKGWILRRQGGYEGSLQAFEKSIGLAKSNDNLPGFYHNKGLALRDLGRDQEAIEAFTQALQLESDTSQYSESPLEVSFGERDRKANQYCYDANVLFSQRRCEEALLMIEKALLVNAQCVQAFIGKGHILLALNRSAEALQCYEKAITLRTKGISSDVLLGLQRYEEVIQIYDEMFQPAPDSTLVDMGKLLNSGLYLPYLSACKEIIKQEIVNVAVCLNIESKLRKLGFHDEAAEAYEKALALVLSANNHDNNQLWEIICYPQTANGPAYLQLELLQRYLANAPTGMHKHDALRHVGSLYSDLFDTTNVSPEIFQNHLDMLHSLLLHLPEESRANALTIVSSNSDAYIIHLLIHLAPYSLPGLSSLAHQVTSRWVPAQQNNDSAYRLYDVLDIYDVPDEDADWLFARQLMQDGLYVQAKSVLDELVNTHPLPDYLWMLAEAMKQCQYSIEEQLHILRKFIALAPSFDARCGETWKKIGELALSIGEGMAAIEAFRKAEGYDYVIPQMARYYAGEWEGFSGLDKHPDYAFPSVVVLDLESDYRSDAEAAAAPGSRVFEIAAVRVKGHTELARCNLIIKRDFPTSKVADRQHEVIEPEQAVRDLQEFIGTSIVVGHNVEAFDAKHLRGMGVAIDDEQIIDTLTFARLLYPDSIHHHLGLLCHEHSILFQGKQHDALPDALACADLLYALGDELVCRGRELLAGFRAFVPPGSAFDRAILQPRGIPADPTILWNPNPTPTTPHILAMPQEASASPNVVAALEQKIDALVERYDPSAAYVQHLPEQQRTVVLVDVRIRLERMIAQAHGKLDLFVLPDPRTLLCPQRLRQTIEQAQDWRTKLALFCLYQESHNHDAQTLYPLRMPSDEPSLSKLRQLLLASCCASEWQHPDTCTGMLAAKVAAENHRTVFATHEGFLHQSCRPTSDIIIVDDADKLQMSFAEYLADRFTSEQLQVWSPQAFNLLNEQVIRYVNGALSNPGIYERVPLQRFVLSLTQPQNGEDTSTLTLLQETGDVGKAIATFCRQAILKEIPSRNLHAYWLEFRTIRQTEEASWGLEQWSICGLSKNLQLEFRQLFWEPYKQHIICGTAISLGILKRTFFTGFFGLPNIAFFADERAVPQVYIPPLEMMVPASFLGRNRWAKAIGSFLYRIASTDKQSLVVSLQTVPVAHALIEAFLAEQHQLNRQLLTPQHNWTTAKIAERLAETERRTIAFISPRMRETALDSLVDIEATGPLRFLNQQDPLVAAHMRLFAQLYPDDLAFSTYLLPQAMLELKTRISSPAKLHIILDSGLHSKIYRDEVSSLFETMSDIPDPEASLIDMQVFDDTLRIALERCGVRSRANVDDETLYMALQTFWDTDSFRESPLNQREIVQAVLDDKDQLVIAATGGGKSLCFQLPALLMAQDNVPKVTLVISPLIALMNDQKEALHNKRIFSATTIHSKLGPIERKRRIERIKRGGYSIIYIAPEQIRSSSLRKALDVREIGLIAIDEAHCVSQWGHDFRTAYISLRYWIETQLCRGKTRKFPIIALTATARNGYRDLATKTIEQGTVQDIIENLSLRDIEVKMPSLERPELEFNVERIETQCSSCNCSLGTNAGAIRCPACGKWNNAQKEVVEEAKIERLIVLLADDSERGLRQRWDLPEGKRQRGLIYCAYRNTTEELARKLRTDQRLNGLRVAAYHAGLSDEKREEVQQHFSHDEGQMYDVVVATNAFGMGIDIRRLGFVIHFDVPGTLEAYIQEAGRAGRDPEFTGGGHAARCILLYHEDDLRKQRNLNERNRIDELDIMNVYDALQKSRKYGEQEIFVTEEIIQQLTGIKEEEKGKIKTALYYLEHRTLAHGKPVLECGEHIPVQWLLAFEHGYMKHIKHPTIDVSSSLRRLINVFQKNDGFRLREREVRMIDGNALAEDMEWDELILRNAIDKLVEIHILVRANHLYIRWAKTSDEASQIITQLEKDIATMVQSVPSQQAFRDGKPIVIDLEAMARAGILSTPMPLFTSVLCEILSKGADSLQLFKHCERTISGDYLIRPIPVDQVTNPPERMFHQLRLMIECYAPAEPKDACQALDLLTEEVDYTHRAFLQQGFLLFNKLGLLSLESLHDGDTAQQIVFKQDGVSADQLEVNLSQLRLIERHRRRKLELMQEYAMLLPKQRMPMLKAYFDGAMPLLEPFDMSSQLTSQQQAIVALSGGYQLIEGPAGSGKTTVLQEHVRYLVEHELVPPERILVTAHYNSAANRISNTMDVYQKDGRAIHAKTLNSLGEDIFTNNRNLLLRPDGQPYYAEKGALQLLRGRSAEDKAMRELVYDILMDMKGQDRYTQWLKRNAEDNCLKNIKKLRQEGIFPTSQIDLEKVGRALGSSKNQGWTEFMYDFYCRYLQLSGEKGIYTYDDQILFALAILQTHAEAANTYQRLYEHIIIDEFQDLTVAAAKLIGVLSQKYQNVMAFGDEAQDIRVKAINGKTLSHLEWRFQQISGIQYQEYVLEKNFRSVQEILDFASLIRSDIPIAAQEADRGVWGAKPACFHVKVNSALSSNYRDALLRTMVDVALAQIELLPVPDKGRVALMVAKADTSVIVENHLRNRPEPKSFYLLKSISYQSRQVEHVLAYYRLIKDKHDDAAIEQILRGCLFIHLKKLKEAAKQNEQSLLDIVMSKELLTLIDITSEEVEVMQRHLAIIDNFGPESCFAEVWQAISELPDGFLTSTEEEEQRREMLDAILEELKDKTVVEALSDVSHHITFLEEHSTDQQLIVTSIDNAKSQAFDTVFLLGPQLLENGQRQRWYVSVSRARNRFFFLVDGHFSEDQENNSPFSWLSIEQQDKLREYYDELFWP